MRGALVCSQAEELIYLWKHYANKMTALPIKQCIMFLRQYYVIFLLKLRQNKLHTNLLFKLLLPNWDWIYNRDLIFNVSGDGFFIRSISILYQALVTNVKWERMYKTSYRPAATWTWCWRIIVRFIHVFIT